MVPDDDDYGGEEAAGFESMCYLRCFIGSFLPLKLLNMQLLFLYDNVNGTDGAHDFFSAEESARLKKNFMERGSEGDEIVITIFTLTCNCFCPQSSCCLADVFYLYKIYRKQ